MNGPNHHSLAIPLPGGGAAFIDGIPDECQHDYTGDTVMVSSKGKVIFWHTYRQWASYTEDYRRRLIYEYHEEMEDPIVEETVTCRKCKKPFTLPIHDV